MFQSMHSSPHTWHRHSTSRRVTTVGLWAHSGGLFWCAGWHGGCCLECMSSTRPLALVLTATASLVVGCDVDNSLLGQPLQGSISTSLERTTVGFRFEGLGTDVDNCPFLDAGAVSFDGVTNAEPIDPYREPGFLIGRQCNGLFLLFDLDAPDVARDAELIVESGANDDVVRYEASGLHANRRLEVEGSTTVAPGGTLRLRFMTDDEVGIPRARTEGSDLPVRAIDDLIEVTIPLWLSSADHVLRLDVPYRVLTTTCEGFSSCEVTGTVKQEVSIRVGL